MIISLVGVHGVGKSTIGRLVAKKMGLNFIDLECIEDAYKLSPQSRQLMFFSTFVLEYLKGVSKGVPVLFSSHPAMVPIYTEYWAGRVEARHMFSLISKLPKADLILILFAPLEVIRKRIILRGRVTSKEEADSRYIYYIQNRVLSLTPYFKALAGKVETVDTNKALMKAVNEVITKISRNLIEKSSIGFLGLNKSSF